ncbi:hypothetical protein K450DRAFT_245913 [Umbelopsis ramanniana AG]|uniref:ATP11-domain-containing protein n=1 Tax=Umbelopsis ramanniana AG TaxID=1314678 RepID=A0AAD5HBZ1_UMBRA|nr:uncharacterized protein K450DRAFT_245913 [Umbelopsis ramanniana AG]KAI8578655.1 hypothetical protein K450DRAFT_245913 [Umbelopsis ramanniana AG]
MATEATKKTIDYDSKYANKLKEIAEKKGANTVQDLKAQMKAEADRVRIQRNKAAEKASKEKAERLKAEAAVKATAPSATSKRSPSQVAAAASTPYDSSAPSLDKIVKLELLEKENAETIHKIWTEYHADKDCITASIPAHVYGTLYQNSLKFPMFIVPVPRDEGVEFFLLQFIYHQAMFTSLLEFKTKGEEARPYLTITHFPELISSKDIVLMKGEITDTKLLSPANAQYLAFALQQFYVTGGESKRKLLEIFHSKPQEFDYNQVIKEMETVI